MPFYTILQRYSSPSSLVDDNDGTLSTVSSSSSDNTSPRVRFEVNNTIPVVKRRKLNCWDQLNNKEAPKMDEERRSYSPGDGTTSTTEQQHYHHKRQHSNNTYDAAQALVDSKGTTRIGIISRRTTTARSSDVPTTTIDSVGSQMIIKEQENEQKLSYHTSSRMTENHESKNTPSPPASSGSISAKRLTSSSSLFPYLPVDLPLFVKKTYCMVQDTCEPNIISWSEDGEMFAIKDMNQFEMKILPLYFDSNKFTSFKRQLHYYGFGKHKQQKSSRNSTVIYYRHENFKRDRPELLTNIQRSTIPNHTSSAGATTGNPRSRSNSPEASATGRSSGVMSGKLSLEERVSRIEEKTNDMCQLLYTIKRQNEAIMNMMGYLIPSSASPSRSAPAAYGANNTHSLTSEIVSYGAEQNSLYADSSVECPSEQYKQSDHL